MTGLLDRLVGWVRSLGGTADAGGEAATDAPTPEAADAGAADTAGRDAPSDHVPDTDEGTPAHTCSVCGTPVDDPEGGCPLCGSTDVVPREADVSALDAETTTASGTATPSASDDPDPPTGVASTAATAGSDAAGDTDDQRDADAHAAEGSLPSSKATEVRTGDSDEDAVSRLRELRNRGDDEDG